MFKKNLFIPDKMEYARNKKPKVVECILCAYNVEKPPIEKLLVYEANYNLVACNLYPYNPGHLMIFPKRHVEDIRELNEKEYIEMFKLKFKCMDILDKIYEPHGYNVGFNIGKASGASISHLHLHIVPRYLNEIGFVDILSGTKTYVESPYTTINKLKEAFKSLDIN